jgi:uroporphyrinogen-III synthase
MQVFAIRPEPGLSSTLEQGRQAGLAITGVPMFEIRPLPWEPPPIAEFDALLIGSANAVRQAGEGLRRYGDMRPVHAVGTATAKAAEDAGLRVERVGQGGLQDIVDRVTGPIRYLRLAGREHVELRLPAAIGVTTRIVYDSVALAMPPVLAEQLARGALVLLHSGAAARHFAAECDRLDIDRQRVHLAALAPRVAEAAGTGWGRILVAPAPSDEALVALAADMCH